MKENISRKILIAQLVLYGLLFFSFNNKTFFPAVGLFSLYLFYLLEDWKKALWLTLVAIFPFGWGLRTFKVEIPLPFYFRSPRQDILFLHFSITARFLISFFLLSVLSFKKKKPLSFDKTDLLLMIFLLLGTVSLFNSSYLELSLIGFSFIPQAVLAYYVARYFLEDKKLLPLTIQTLFVLAIFEGFFAIGQFLLKRPLGRILEEGLMLAPLGKAAAENIFQSRSMGTFTDPNTMAIFWLMLVSLILSQIVCKNPLLKRRRFLSLAFLFSLAGLIFTFSRAAWAIFFVVTAVFLFYLVKKRIFSFKYKSLFWVIAAIFLIASPLLMQRVLSLKLSLWSDYGEHSTLSSRLDLAKEAVYIISQHPFLGTGPGNFLSAMMVNNFTGVANHFLYPVHNLYLLLASELGLPALGCFLIFLLLILKSSLSHAGTEKEFQGIKLGLLMGVFAYLLAALVYTADRINFEFFFLMLGILRSL